MSLSATYRRGAPVSALCGLLLTLFIAAGCGRKPAPAGAAAAAKPKTEALKTNDVAVVQTNLTDEYVSVFEDLPPQQGKDPFFPYSHRRDPKIETPTPGTTEQHVDPVLVLRGILGSGKNSQAVINNQGFMTGEEQLVRVPNGKVLVRCIEIHDDYVLIQVEGEAEPKKLTMGKKSIDIK